MDKPNRLSRLHLLAATAIAAVVFGCSSGPPASTAATPAAAPTAPASASQTPAPATPDPATPGPTSAPTATAAPTDTAPTATSPAAGATTWTLVMADGPREGTWEVSLPPTEVAPCQYLPDLDRWLATWLGPPPLSFINPTGDEDPFLLFTFTEEDESELSFIPTGEVTFEVDDRGETATLSWVSESHEGNRYDSAGNNLGSIEAGEATLTIECGSIFRHT